MTQNVWFQKSLISVPRVVAFFLFEISTVWDQRSGEDKTLYSITGTPSFCSDGILKHTPTKLAELSHIFRLEFNSLLAQWKKHIYRPGFITCTLEVTWQPFRKILNIPQFPGPSLPWGACRSRSICLCPRRHAGQPALPGRFDSWNQ